MMKHLVYLIVAIALLTTSCTYYPRLTGIPLIKEKGDTRIEGGITILVPNIQASVSRGVSEKIAIQAAISGNSINHYGHGAIGLYKKVLQDRNVIELYGGFGYGSGNQDGPVTSVYQHGNYQMYFTQFNFGNIEKKTGNMESGLGIKFGYIHTNMNVTAEFYQGFENQKGIFVEPTGFFRFGGPKWKFHATLGYGRWFQISNNTEIYWFPANLGVGVSYSFGGVSNK